MKINMILLYGVVLSLNNFVKGSKLNPVVGTLTRDERQKILAQEVEDRAYKTITQLDNKTGGHAKTAALVYQLFADNKNENSRLNNLSKKFLGIDNKKNSDEFFAADQKENHDLVEVFKKKVTDSVKDILATLNKKVDQFGYIDFLVLEKDFIKKVDETRFELAESIKKYNEIVASI